jgi:hypothetical protein
MKTAIVTASYSGDFERCRLLCESIDRRVTGYSHHYILVEKGDVGLFQRLANPRRLVVDERSILPRWLVVVPDPLTFGRRRIWLTPKGKPLRGWHVQQMRKIAMARSLTEDGALLCDSDTVFVREADLSQQWTNGRFAFYRRKNGIQPAMIEHQAWSARSARLLGIHPSMQSSTDYISPAVSWRMDTVREMVARIEAVTGRGWETALAADRCFSECLIYGRFVDEVECRPDRHARSDTPISHTYWTGSAMDAQSLASFFQKADSRQPAVGIQSFIGTDLSFIRMAAGLN